MPVSMADLRLMGAAFIGFMGRALLTTEYLQTRRADQALHDLPAGRAVAGQVAFCAGQQGFKSATLWAVEIV